MADELYIHTWSNGDISIHCSKCVGVKELNHSSYSDYRVYSRHYSQGDLTDKVKFIGCTHCKRGAEVIVIRKSIYQLQFGTKDVVIHYKGDFLGHQKFHQISWTYYNTQDIYNGHR